MTKIFIENPLAQLLLLPVIGAVILICLPSAWEKRIKASALIFSLPPLALAVKLYNRFDASAGGLQFGSAAPWIPDYGIYLRLGIDGISLALIALTALLMPLAILASFSQIKERQKYFYASLLFLQTGMFGVFCAADLFLFYVFWEAALVPMYFLIGIWGGPRRVYAAVKFFIYTMAASVLMLAAVIFIALAHKKLTGSYSFNIQDLAAQAFSVKTQLWLFSAFALAFAVKIPLFPFHTWLPDAHVEAPAAGSVILAGVLLKMGIYGYMRLAMPLFPDAARLFLPWLAVTGVVGIVYGSLVAWSQSDLKKMVAYSSVAHMGAIMLGAASLEPAAVAGSLLQMINHGLSTGALFFLVGILYERRHSRQLDDYGGLAQTMPHCAAVFMIVLLSSIGLPGLNGFAGEFLILFGSFKIYPWLAATALFGVVFSAVYMLGAYQKIFLGPIKHDENRSLPDLTIREYLYLLPLIFFIFYLGISPSPFLKKTEVSIKTYIQACQEKKTSAPALSAAPDRILQ